MRNNRLLTALCAVLVSSTIALTGAFAGETPESKDQETADHELIVIPAEVNTPEVVEIYSGKESIPAEEGEDPGYFTYKAQEGRRLVSLTLHLAVEDPGTTQVLPLSDVRLHVWSGEEEREILPFAQFEDPDWRSAGPDASVEIAGKAALELAYDIPSVDLDAVTLSVAGKELGSIASFTEVGRLAEPMRSDEGKHN